ncbi:hypothetical protein [uncultured Ruminococcus sp.]|uniref:hypothetical protein n=1 Tax=uncultured Ruminococcus sp. TaxID=165186 RepID=UPI0025F36E7F|nr:hypothetical protein [uncultured Ruminococcus sp.]
MILQRVLRLLKAAHFKVNGTPPLSAFNTRRRSALKAVNEAEIFIIYFGEIGWKHVYNVP